MKTLCILVASIFAFNVMADVTPTPPHIGPEGLRFNKLHILKVEKLIQNRLEDKGLSEEKADEAKDLAFLLAVGKRATSWIDAVNADRETNKLDLSNPQKSGGIPMTAPNKVNT